MATTWSPIPIFERRSWLLGNGDVIEEPLLEETATGLKVRIAGTTKSVYRREQDDLIISSLEAAAKARNTYVWLALDEQKMWLEEAARHKRDERPVLYLLNDSPHTVAYWTFKHPSLPIEAILTVIAEPQAPKQHRVQVTLALVDTRRSADTLRAYCYREESPLFSATQRRINESGRLIQGDLADQFTANEANWNQILGSHTFPNPRQMVEHLLKVVREADELASIEVPNLSNLAGSVLQKVSWLTLPFLDSNVNSQFVSDLTEYLRESPSVEKALRLYNELRAALKTLGIGLEERTTNNFQQALLAGDKEALTVDVTTLVDESRGFKRPPKHTLTMHIPSGTLIVNCSERGVDHDQVARDWDEAVMIAEVTGQETALLAYAREYARTGNERRAQAILKQRRQGVNP